MTDRLNLPAVPLGDDVIDRVAREIAAQVADHIESMYPDAARANVDEVQG